jgi:hypothetical protein
MCEKSVFQHPANERREDMMITTGKYYRTERLIDLERTVAFLNGQLHKMQWDLYRAKAEPLPIRLWRNLMSPKGRQQFMSAVCTRRVRPNTKMVSHVDSRA